MIAIWISYQFLEQPEENLLQLIGCQDSTSRLHCLSSAINQLFIFVIDLFDFVK